MDLTRLLSWGYIRWCYPVGLFLLGYSSSVVRITLTLNLGLFTNHTQGRHTPKFSGLAHQFLDFPLEWASFLYTTQQTTIWVCSASYPVVQNLSLTPSFSVDSYQNQAASALAAKTFVRSLWGASVVLFTVQMYHRLGYEWAGSLLAFISLACCGIPFLFFFWGAKIRKFSRFAYSPDDGP